MPCFPMRPGSVLVLSLLLTASASAQQGSDILLPPGVPSGLPAVEANDNRVPAGSWVDGVQEISLEVRRADWRIESPDRPGLRVAAVAEVGGPPQVPAPLIRVETGTRLRVRLHNTLADEPLTVFGLYAHPAEEPEPITLAPGEERTVEFEAGEPGTYLYRMREGPAPDPEQPRFGYERDQLAGAFVVDPAGGESPDRILVMNIFSAEVDTAVSETGMLEALTVNGLSFPSTEREKMSVGDAQRWRVVNASRRGHPMHLHGFYYTVLSRGTQSADTIYAPKDRRLVVTEQMRPRTTMSMEWTPTRPGAWLFHCHLSFHVAPHIRLPGAEAADHEDHEVHMAGLVVGIEVAPGPTDLIARGETKQLHLFANEYGDRVGYRYGFAIDPEFMADSVTDVPGPMLAFHQYESVDVTVHNRMSFPTGVHWHGLELDGWADGVPGWSRSDGRMSPAIGPGDSFTYRLSFMRPGTFIYHSHLNDVEQLTGGLYGPLIVLEEGETFDPDSDHVMTFGWNTPEAQSLEDVDLNGGAEQPTVEASAGERHRFRVINIAPAGNISAWIYRGEEGIPITLLARDGADLPAHQQVPVASLPRVGVGATADFTWTPTEPGTYEVRVGFTPQASHRQTWVVR